MDWIVWVNTMAPLTYSAGPGNIMVAVSGVRVGFLRSVPFILGLDITYFLLSVLVGLGVGSILISYPLVAQTLKYFGIGYILYLGLKFFIASSSSETNSGIKFRIIDGVIIQLTNVKGMIMLIVMFSEFSYTGLSHTNNGLFEHVLLISAALATLNFSAHILWVFLGSGIQRTMARYPIFQRVYNYLFGSMLIGVAIWLLVRF